MTQKTDFPVSVTLTAVDKATAPLQRLTAKFAALTAPFNRVGEAFSKFGKAAGFETFGKALGGVGGAVKNVGSEFFNLGARLVGLGTTAAFVFGAILKGAVDAGDKLGEVSDRVGLSVDSFASLQHAAAQFDVDAESFTTAMDKFNKNLGDMTAGKGGEFLKFLNEISPTLARQMKAAKGTEDAFAIMTDAFAKVKDPAKRAILASHAFGKSGLQMGVFLSQGSAAIQEQQRAFMRLAGSQEAFARNAGVLDNVMRESELAFTGLRNAAMGALFPAISKLLKVITDFLVKNRDGLERWATRTAAAIEAWVDGGGVQRLVSTLEVWADILGPLIDDIGGFKVVLALVAAVMAGPLVFSILALIPALYSLSVALLTTPVGWFALAVGLAVAAIVGYGIMLYQDWPDFGRIWEDIKAQANAIVDLQKSLLTLNTETIFAKWTVAVDAYKQSLYDLIHVMRFIPGVGMIVSNLAIAAGADEKLLPRNAVRSEGRRGAARMQHEAPAAGAITVDFKNVPRGALVSMSPESKDLNMSLGYAMVTP